MPNLLAESCRNTSQAGCLGRNLLLALFVALAVAPPMLLVQVPDLTGAWLIRSDIQVVNSPGVFLLAVFHWGGTFGENNYHPFHAQRVMKCANVRENNRISRSGSKVTSLIGSLGQWLAQQSRLRTCEG
jgi:hypothetical protein